VADAFPRLSLIGAVPIMKTKIDRKTARDALALRMVENRSNYNLAKELTEKFLTLADSHRLPGQREMLIGYMLVAHGFELAHPAKRVNRDLAFADLDRLERRLVEFKPGEGDGIDEF
jgi:hypothetical protein